MGKGRIFIVEDESIVAMDIQLRLARQGFEVAGLAAEGPSALTGVAETKPDLVLMDVLLHGAMDGIDTAREIRAQHSLPVIFLTAAADESTLERAKEAAPSGWLAKPFEDHELAAAIEIALVRFEADTKLKDSQRLLSTTLGSLAEAVLSLDGDGRLTYMNVTAERLLGISKTEALGRGWAELFTVIRESSREPLRGIEEVCGPVDCQPQSEDMVLLGPSGTEVPVAFSVSPLYGQGRNGAGSASHGHVVVLRDVTIRKRAEDELRKSMTELRAAFRQTVRALATLAEKRDPYTAGHQQRVARLACAIGRFLDLGADALEGLEMAGILHDVGKVYVPAEILAKPARLSQMEMGIMKSHPEVGFEILHEVNFPWPVARAVLEHHERLDGSGYPGGLRDGEICHEARILCVADVVEAMSSHRPYRPALGLAMALDEIRSGRGRIYDADVVDACLLLFDSGGFNFEDASRSCTGQKA